MSDKKELLPPARSTTSTTPENFGDGGAFPEIHVAQYPLGMGRKGGQEKSKILPVTVDAHGNVAFDAIVRQHENASTIVTVSPPEVDPLEPPKFNHKKVRKEPGSPPVPVMHSPPRPLTVKDYQDLKIPPCISNWKSPKGYTIPLDKRLAADGRGLQEVQINDNFAKLAETLYVAEEKARVSVAMRRKVEKEMLLREKERKERDLGHLAQKARSERDAGGAPAAPPPSPSSVCMTTSDGIVSGGGDQDMRGDYEKVKENNTELQRESKEEREY